VIVALVLAVLLAVAATTALVLARRDLAAARVEVAAAGARAEAAGSEARDARGDADAATARAERAEDAQRAVAGTAEEVRAALSASEQRAATTSEALRRCEEQRARTEGELATAGVDLERAEAAAEAATVRLRELEESLHVAERVAQERAQALEAAAERGAALERRVVAVPAGATPPSTDGLPLLDRCWRLLLARVERQWAGAVGAGADERGVASGTGDDQLHEAVARELERLREEVGLDTAVTRTGAMDAHPLLVLLAAGELAALTAPLSERVEVELGDRLVVVGGGWSDDLTAVEGLRATLADTGLPGEVVVDGGDVRIVAGGPPGPP
jgi:hypothetical protein